MFVLAPTASPGVAPRRQTVLRTLAALALTGGLIAMAGCASGSSNGSNGSSTNGATVEPANVESDLEARYVIGPAAAREIGYRIDWQYPAFSRYPITRVEIQHDSLFALDAQNALLRVDLESGRRIWEVPVAHGTDQILGITYIPDAERIYLTTSVDMFILDAATGAIEGRKPLNRAAGTGPVVHGQFFIYGARDGKLAWWSYQLGADWKAYQLGQTMSVQPVYGEGHVVAVSDGGRIMNLYAGSATQVWNRRALDEIVVSPVIGDGAVFVASLDQHLRAYELGRDRSALWDYLTESPLTESPVLVNDRVYQQVATEGVVCLEAQPLDSPGGVVIWKCAGATGSVVTQHGSDILAWDSLDQRLAIIDGRIGALVETWNLPAVSHIISNDVDGGSLIAVGRDGRIIRLSPRS